MTSAVRIGLAVAVVATVVLLVTLGGALGTTTSLTPGEPAPDVEIQTFEGERYRLSDLQGHPVVINFWASWCTECGDEAADLEAIWQAYRDRGVMVLGVNYTDTRPAAEAYLAEYGVTYPSVSDLGGAVSRAFRLTGVPETVVVDSQGRLVGLPQRGLDTPTAKFIGPIVPTGRFTPTDLRRVLDRLLEDQA